MSIKVFGQQEDVGIHIRHRGELINTVFLTERDARHLCAKLLAHFPEVAFTEHSPREWAEWDDVPAGVQVESMGRWGRTKSGSHDKWLKSETGRAWVWWANKDGNLPAHETALDTRLEPTCGPFREVVQ